MKLTNSFTIEDEFFHLKVSTRRTTWEFWLDEAQGNWETFLLEEVHLVAIQAVLALEKPGTSLELSDSCGSDLLLTWDRKRDGWFLKLSREDNSAWMVLSREDAKFLLRKINNAV